MDSGFDDKTTKKCGSGGEEKRKNDEFRRGIAREGLFLPVARKEEGNWGLLTKIRALDRGWLRLGELRLEVGDQSMRTSLRQTVIRN